ncbi:hypothetical protein CYLTODRAFT_417852 [Cylindrobasidium torrendii FP15055 ss-10]|uniref:Pyridoxal phosphate homeostasis protein n=1 Tax=Cylindrobasidium torrendii FP15055 ss-10 TaxID=1314674 RepID=A0A0D7BPH3_9AGAR|nr:hypothetical protein CYLTODRAFT_417852 [Cylindrobasidium torrendii FP15055 ss-10]
MSTDDRKAELFECLDDIRARVPDKRQLVAVSKYKPASDVRACFEHGQLDFGENYVQELEDKAKELPPEIRWHFIGTLQSNKAKTLAAIPNLHTIQTLTSTKAASALNKNIPDTRTTPLNILIQVNTSGEDVKSGLPPLTAGASTGELTELAKFIVTECPKLSLQGLMTIGSLEQSLNSEGGNNDFETLKATRDVLEKYCHDELAGKSWGVDGRLLLSMGMSSDFEAALKAGSDIVRVGTGIFGGRKTKTEIAGQK